MDSGDMPEFLEKRKNFGRRLKSFQRNIQPELIENGVEFIDFDGASNNRRLPQPGRGLKIMTPDQMHMRLPVALAQIKAGNNSQQLMNEVRQLLYSLYKAKRMTKKVYDDLMSKI